MGWELCGREGIAIRVQASLQRDEVVQCAVDGLSLGAECCVVLQETVWFERYVENGNTRLCLWIPSKDSGRCLQNEDLLTPGTRPDQMK